MKGLELAEQYFFAVGAPMIQKQFPDYERKIAAGLMGMGSDCFGFDDEISRDHDWGPTFYLWLTKTDYEAIGTKLQSEFDNLPRSFAGFGPREESTWGKGRSGVFGIGQFYKQFIGFDHPPQSLKEWRIIPESNLATATNGRVFIDPLGEFSAFRRRLMEFYPEDVRLKKIASRCMTISQAGQYNYLRCVRRQEYVAAHWNEAKFISDLISLVFLLLNRQYRPFPKWMHRSMQNLVILGGVLYDLLLQLVILSERTIGQALYERKSSLMEEMCQLAIQEIRREGLSDSPSDFLLNHGPVIQSHIQDPQIRAIDVWAE
jgi:hypothetical protein